MTIELLTRSEIEQMRKEITDQPPIYKPPKGREYWDVGRIVATLEATQLLLAADESTTEAIVKDIYEYIQVNVWEISKPELADLERFLRERLRSRS